METAGPVRGMGGNAPPVVAKNLPDGLTGRERPGRRFARVGPHAVNENLAPPGSAHIIVAHSMDKQLPPWALRRFGCDAGSC